MHTVNILMSTFNGEPYLSEQIESIMNQAGVWAMLTIRDDGSSDNTVPVIKEMQGKYPGRIELLSGENIGYKKSFLRLLGMAKQADYYGFSDQDDVWKEEKCIVGIKELDKADAKVKLYASGVVLTDEKLNLIKKTECRDLVLTVPGVFARHRMAGCTYVFSEELKKMAASFIDMDYPEHEMPEHDFLLFALALAFGEVKIGLEPYIYHRRHQNSVTAGGNGIKKRIRTEFSYLLHAQNVRRHLADELLGRCREGLHSGDYKFLLSVSSYKKNIKERIRLLFCRELSCGMLIGDVEARIKILLGIF